MVVRCIANTGKFLRKYEDKSLKKKHFGKFGTSWYTECNDLSIGEEYFVVAMSFGEGTLGYLLEGFDIHHTALFFEVIDHRISPKWFFNSFNEKNSCFPYREAVWGFYEYAFDQDFVEKLFEGNKNTKQIYLERTIELKNSLL